MTTTGNLPSTGGTGDATKLAGFDMVFGLSEQAINSQWATLYRTPMPSSNADSDIRPGRSQVKYLLSRELSIIDPTTRNRLEGTIAPPMISLTNLSSTASPYRTVRMNFSLLESNFKYWVPSFTTDDGPPTMTQKLVSMNGWNFSFEASIGSMEIRKVLEGNSPASVRIKLKFAGSLPKDVVAPLNKAVTSSDFLASTIFCLFQDTEIANTFKLEGPQGTDSSDLIIPFLNGITQHFKSLNEKAAVAGQHNYVLGYSIQQRPTVTTPNAGSLTPTNFLMTTTPSTRVSTLNFDMVTGNSPLPADIASGVFSESFFTMTKSSAEHNGGILALSAETFVNKILKPTILPTLAPWTIRGYPEIFDIASSNSQEDKSLPGSLTINSDWVTKTLKDSSGLLNVKQDTKGRYETTIKWTSDAEKFDPLTPYPVMPIDARRRMYLTINLRSTTFTMVETSPRGIASDDWSEAADISTAMNLQLSFYITPTTEGKWSFEIDEENTKLPTKDDQGHLVQNQPDGLEVKQNYHGIFKIGDAFGINKLVGLNDALNSEAENVARSAAGEVFVDHLQDIAQKIILPAGDAFIYTGLSTDTRGHIYSHIDYRTITNGTVSPSVTT